MLQASPSLSQSEFVLPKCAAPVRAHLPGGDPVASCVFPSSITSPSQLCATHKFNKHQLGRSLLQLASTMNSNLCGYSPTVNYDTNYIIRPVFYHVRHRWVFRDAVKYLGEVKKNHKVVP